MAWRGTSEFEHHVQEGSGPNKQYGLRRWSCAGWEYAGGARRGEGSAKEYWINWHIIHRYIADVYVRGTSKCLDNWPGEGRSRPHRGPPQQDTEQSGLHLRPQPGFFLRNYQLQVCPYLPPEQMNDRGPRLLPYLAVIFAGGPSQPCNLHSRAEVLHLYCAMDPLCASLLTGMVK